MAYNKAKAEKEWLRWKEVEEKKLRELGVDEETIQRLHTYDWAQFNKERQYLQRQVDWSPYVDWVSAQDLELPVEDTESLLDSIEDMELFSLLHTVDKLTLEILFMKINKKIFMTCVIFRLFSWAMGRTGKKKRSPCSLKSEYQPCGYIPA